jgi:hypothetical protein
MREILATRRYDTDKSDEYLRNYENCFSNLRTSPIVLMEIGVNKGGSLLLWRDYFTQGSIVGVDLNPPLDLADETGRIQMFQCDQADSERLGALADRVSPAGLDIIIDDASHIASLTAITFQTLFYKHLKPGGFYAIEDWGTGYWTNWPDGSFPEHIAEVPTFVGNGNQFRSHQSGMVGLLKQLIDECGVDDVYHPRLGAPGGRRSQIRSIHISSGLAIITKMPEVCGKIDEKTT